MRAAWIRVALAAIVCGGGLGGCSGSSEPSAQASSDGGVGGGSCSAASSFPSAPVTTVTTDGGKLRVAIHGAPYQPLIAGLQCVELVVTDVSTDATLDGLAITMTPWMPAMGHGASVTPSVTALGEGRYVFTNVSLFMPGEWELRMQFSGEVTDSVAPTFSVD
jgi:hypothetical protein